MLKNNWWSEAIGTVFTNAEIEAAGAEMNRTSTNISSISRNGIYVGATGPNGLGHFAAYDKHGIYMGILNFAWGNYMDGRFENVSSLPWALMLGGTEFEEEAKSICFKIAQADDNNDELAYSLLRDSIEELRLKTRHVINAKSKEV